MELNCSCCKKDFTVNKNSIHCLRCDGWLCKTCWCEWNDEQCPYYCNLKRGEHNEFIAKDCDLCLYGTTKIIFEPDKDNGEDSDYDYWDDPKNLELKKITKEKYDNIKDTRTNKEYCDGDLCSYNCKRWERYDKDNKKN